MPVSGERMTQTQVYSLDELDEFKTFLDEIVHACQAQGIPAENITAEYAPGQFEVNLKHSTDVLLACDHAMLLKRVVRAIAKKHGFHANFMVNLIRNMLAAVATFTSACRTQMGLTCLGIMTIYCLMPLLVS